MTLLQKIQNLTWWTLDIKLKDILTDLFGRVEILEEGNIEEAPIDGIQYARQDGEWSEVTGGGGSQNLQSVLEVGSSAIIESNPIEIIGTVTEDSDNWNAGGVSIIDGRVVISQASMSNSVHNTLSLYFETPTNDSTLTFPAPSLLNSYYVPISINGNFADASGNIEVNGSSSLPTYADNAAAIVGGLEVDNWYKTATGELRVVI